MEWIQAHNQSQGLLCMSRPVPLRASTSSCKLVAILDLPHLQELL